MGFIKKHGKSIVIAIVIIGLFAGLLFSLKKMLYSDDQKDIYGNRLDGIEEHPIDNGDIEKIKTELEATEKIETFSYRLQGKVMNFNIDVKKEVSIDDAKSLTDKILTNLSDDTKGFYDIQVFLTSKTVEGETLFPIIGYKHETNLIFSWSNTRVIENET